MGSISSRLAVVQNDTKHILRMVTEIHGKAEKQDKRIDNLETSQGKTDAHLRWMKGIFTAVQAAVLAWFSSK